MADDKQRPTFWTSLPAVLAGLASLITAIVAALAFFDRGKPAAPPTAAPAPQTAPAWVAPQTPGPSEKPSTTAPPAPALTAVPADDAGRDVAACQRIAGRWVWSTGGFVSIGADGSLQWRPRASDPQPAVVGRWVCTQPKERQYLFSWSHGFTDVFVLSADGQRVNGTNQQTQTPLFGNRQK